MDLLKKRGFKSYLGFGVWGLGFGVWGVGSFDRVSHQTSLLVHVEFVVCNLSNFVRSEERRVGKEC